METPTIRTAPGHRSHLRWVLVAVGCAVTVAACGSSGHPGATAASAHYSQGVKFSACMRAHGVTNFPDPRASGGIHIQMGSGINPFSPAFKAAQAACRSLAPFGLGANQHPSAQQIAATRQISECMRSHGVTGFPDPIFKPPSSPAGYSILEDRGGVILAVPSTINPQSPVFEAAAKACHFS
jgi:hypothetical protein